MGEWLHLAVMVASAVGIIAVVRFGMCAGIDRIAAARRWPVKIRGQMTGFATSVPEFVALIAVGLSGVWTAGLWNIISSNMINWGLMLSAALVYRQERELFNWRFVDEVVFALLAVGLPVLLNGLEVDRRWYVVPGLIAFFAVYVWVDRKVNALQAASVDEEEDGAGDGSLAQGLMLLAGSLVCILLLGNWLGSATERVVVSLGVPAMLAGVILGVVTSLPEMTTFFTVYARAKQRRELAGLEDTQEVLDNLTFSNMSNVGIIYPVGLTIFLLVTWLA